MFPPLQNQSALDELVQSSLEGIHANVAVRNREGKIVDFLCILANPAARRLVNAPPNWVGRTLLDCFPQAKDSGLFELTVDVIESNRDNTFEYRLVGVKEERWIRLALAKKDDGVIAIISDVTQNVIKGRNLQKAQHQLEAHLLRTPLAAMEWDLDFKIQRWNPAAETIFGWSETEAIGRHASFLLPEVLHGKIGKVWNDLIKQQGGLRNTNENITKDGKVILCEWYNTPLLDRDGNVTGVASLTQDITKRNETELELVKTNRALKMLSSCNATLIGEKHEHTLLKEICRIAVEIGGYRMAWVGYAENDADKTVRPIAYCGDEMDYLSESRFSWSAYLPEGQGIVGRTVRSGKPVVVPDISVEPTFHVWQEAAERRSFRGVIGLPLRDRNHVFGVLALYSTLIHRPSSSEVALLQELADNLAFGIACQRTDIRVKEQAALLDEAQDAIFVQNMKGRITYWNKGAERLFGWTVDEAQGRHANSLLYDDEEFFDRFTQQIIDKGIWTGEVDQLRKDGHCVTVESRMTLVLDDEGAPKSILAINTDITNRKRLESRLLHMQRMESIGTLAGGIAHDLNNILTPILMSVNFLQERVDDEKGRLILATIKASGERGADLIRQVLSFARGIEGKRIPVPPVDLLLDVEKIIQDTFPKNISFVWESSSDLWPAKGDPNQLHQVLMNLCLNARDAMPSGGELKIKLQNEVINQNETAGNQEIRPGSYVLIRVSDSGIGIPPETAERIFEPFYTTKTVGEGTGLGLSTSLAIVRSHGGLIYLDTSSKACTTLKIYLPADLRTRTPTGPLPKRKTASTGNGQLILLVDDEEGIRISGQAILEKAGYHVLTAENGAEAVKLYTEAGESIDLVLTDLTMPVMDGRQEIVELRRINPDIKIIASSGVSPLPPGWLEDVSVFLSKPYSADTLLDLVRQTLGDENSNQG